MLNGTKSETVGKIMRPLKAAGKLEQQQNSAELQQYFHTQFPPLVNETIVSLITTASSLTTNQQLNLSAQKPDAFFHEIKCFKVGVLDFI